MKKYILIIGCLLVLVTGCEVERETKVDKVKREIQLYNENVENIINNYETNYETAQSIEKDLVHFLITIVSSENLSKVIPEFENRRSLLAYIEEKSLNDTYFMSISDDNKKVFKEYIKGYSEDYAVVDYYMESKTGNLYEEIVYYNEDSRVLTFEIVWKDGKMLDISVIERGSSIDEETEPSRQQ